MHKLWARALICALFVAPAGNLNGDTAGRNDFTVGAPGRNGGTGTIYQVTDPRLPDPGRR